MLDVKEPILSEKVTLELRREAMLRASEKGFQTLWGSGEHVRGRERATVAGAQ